MLDRIEDQNDAMEAAAAILPHVFNLLDDAVSFYFSDDYSMAARAEHDERATASCIYAHAEKRMHKVIDIVAGARLIRLQGLKILNFENKALLRFKKVSADGRHRNYQTKQQQNYDDQLPLPGIPEPAFRLTAGYQLNAVGSALERIMIARPIGKTIFWTAQVVMCDGAALWEDITPRRFGTMEASDFDSEIARARRGR